MHPAADQTEWDALKARSDAATSRESLIPVLAEVLDHAAKDPEEDDWRELGGAILDRIGKFCREGDPEPPPSLDALKNALEKLAEAANADDSLRIVNEVLGGPSGAGEEVLRDWQSLKSEPPVRWLVEDLLPVGGLSLIAASPKVGKSTLVRELLASHGSGGGAFLGRLNRHGGSFLYVALDEHPSMIRDHFVKLATVYKEDALSASANFVTRPIDPANLPVLIRVADANLVVVDTLGQYVSGVENAGEYFEWTHIMAGLREAATETGAHIVLIHHARKTGGSRGLSVLGSQAIAGAVDSIIELEAIYDKTSGTYRRFISSTNRAGKDIPKTGLELDPEHGTVSLDKSRGSAAFRRLEARSLKAEGLTPKQIAEKLDISVPTVYRYLKDEKTDA